MPGFDATENQASRKFSGLEARLKCLEETAFVAKMWPNPEAAKVSATCQALRNPNCFRNCIAKNHF